MNYRLSCISSNERHTTFNLFDRTLANCGTITVLTSDLVFFLQHSWKGDIFWNGLFPEGILDGTNEEIIIKGLQ